MHVRIKDISGNVYTSDSMSRADMLEELGGDEYELLNQVAKVVDLFKNVGRDSLNHITITIEGQERSFNPRNVIWVEIHGLEEFDLDA